MKRFFFAVLILTILFGIKNSIMAQSKGGHWQFENNGFDTADWDASDNAGTLIDSASYGQEAPLQDGVAYLWLDPALSHNFMKVEDSGDLDFTDENIGISAWIYPVVLNTAHFCITKGTQNTNPKTTNYALRISKSKNLEFLIRDSNNQAQTIASSFTIALNQWTFVAAFYDFQAHKVYMWNSPVGAPADTLDFNQNLFANDGPLAIGAWYVNDESAPSTANFKGRIDDVRISGRMVDVVPGMTAIDHPETAVTELFQLKQNFPNPFNSSTTIGYSVEEAGWMRIEIIDLRGRLVQVLTDQWHSAGSHKVAWPAQEFPSGVYFSRLITESGFQQTKKMMMLK